MERSQTLDSFIPASLQPPLITWWESHWCPTSKLNHPSPALLLPARPSACFLRCCLQVCQEAGLQCLIADGETDAGVSPVKRAAFSPVWGHSYLGLWTHTTQHISLALLMTDLTPSPPAALWQGRNRLKVMTMLDFSRWFTTLRKRSEMLFHWIALCTFVSWWI